VSKARLFGGYYIKARQIQESTIMKRPPVVREVWDLLLRECNHKDIRYGGKTIRRGQCIRSLKDIRDSLKWMVGYTTRRYSEQQMKRAMKVLKNDTMIDTTKTTRGLIITVLNYDLYQNPSNYERQTNDTTSDTVHDTNAEPMPNQGCPTINKNDKNEYNEKNVKNGRIYSPTSEEVRLSELLHSLISQNNPTFKPPSIKKWSSTMDKILRLDKRDWRECEDVIRWCQQDEFWHTNILSPEKLRKQYDQLLIKMKKPNHLSKTEKYNKDSALRLRKMWEQEDKENENE